MIKVPKNEILWVQYLHKGKVIYVTTSTMMRDTYFLYKVEDDGKLVKTRHKSSNPQDLEKFIVRD